MDEMKMEEPSEAEERDLDGQEEVIEEEKKGKPLFPLPIVFGAGIAAFLIVAAVFAGQAGLESQLKAGIGATATPTLMLPADIPPCSDFDTGVVVGGGGAGFGEGGVFVGGVFVEGDYEYRMPVEPEESDDPNVSTPPPECKEAVCLTEFEGALRAFSGEQGCLPAAEKAYCRGVEVEVEKEEKVIVKRCQLVGGPITKDSCMPIDVTLINYNDMCGELDEGCFDEEDYMISDTSTSCVTCWEVEDLEGDKEEIKVRCLSEIAKQEKIAVTDECEIVPKGTGQEGWRVDRSNCKYDKLSNSCYQSCQVVYSDENDFCRETKLPVGECSLVKDEDEDEEPTDTPPILFPDTSDPFSTPTNTP